MSITARLVSTRSVSILELNHTTSHWFVARGLNRVFPQKNTSSHCCGFHCRIPAGFSEFFPKKHLFALLRVSLQDSSRISTRE
jgi:hypothetical protein